MNDTVFTQFIQRNSDLIHSIAHRYHDKLNDHDDLYQEGLTKLWNVYEEYDNTYSETTFIYTVLTNFYRDIISSSNTKSRQNYDAKGNMVGDIKNFNFDILTIEFNIIDDMFKESVIDIAFDLLEEEQYKDGFIKLLYGETYEAVSDLYGVSKQNIDQTFRRYLEKVRLQVDKQLGISYNNYGV